MCGTSLLHNAFMTSPAQQPRDRQSDGSSDRRWVVLTEDGRYGTMGRAGDPSEEEIREIEKQLRGQGLAGWLAIMSGSAYAPELPILFEVRPLASPTKTFSEASVACLANIRVRRDEAEG